jgi:hypothetical protein
MEYPYLWANTTTVDAEGEEHVVRDPRRAAKYVRDHIQKREENLRLDDTKPGYSTYFHNYVASNYRPLKITKWKPSLGTGISLICQFRLNCFFTDAIRDKVGLVPPVQPRCPTCGIIASENRVHIMFHCATYAVPRQRYLMPLLAGVDVELPVSAKLVYLLGGGTLNQPGEYEQGRMWRVAAFFQRMQRVRTRLLRARYLDLGGQNQALANQNLGEDAQDIIQQAAAEEWT